MRIEHDKLLLALVESSPFCRARLKRCDNHRKRGSGVGLGLTVVDKGRGDAVGDIILESPDGS